MRTAYHEQLSELSEQLGAMCGLAGAAMERATQALLQADLVLAEQVISDHEKIAEFGKVFGRRAVWGAFERYLRDRAPQDADVRVAIAHAEAAPAAQRLAEMVARVRPQATLEHVVELGAAVGAHGGPGALGLAVLVDS